MSLPNTPSLADDGVAHRATGHLVASTELFLDKDRLPDRQIRTALAGSYWQTLDQGNRRKALALVFLAAAVGTILLTW